jgi:PTH1 family peptidyl-tRNA hydrolase
MAFRRTSSSPDQGTFRDVERFIIVGLGNPGKKYERTRHNVGQEAIELLAKRHDASLKAGRDKALIAECRIHNVAVVLAVPTTYMNDSGEAVGPLARRYKVTDPSRIIVLHDELDLEPGIVKIKVGGGLAGHNGLRSISQHLKTDDYVRVRIGVGKPRSKEQGADHVLSKVSSTDRQVLVEAIDTAATAVELILSIGVNEAMQRIHSQHKP